MMDNDAFEQLAIENVLQLIAIPGASRAEHDVAAFLVDRLRMAGVPETAVVFDNAHRKSGGGTIGNLIVKLPGTRRGVRRLLMAHMDTVPLAVGTTPRLDGEWIRSSDPHRALGGDDRAGCAVLLTCLQTLLQHDLPRPPLTLVWTVQEEIGLRGARFLNTRKLGAPRLCFNFDGGAPEVVVTGATGDINMEIEITGIASHAGAHPEQGVSAAAIAGLAIADLVQNGWHGLIEKGNRRGTSNIGVIRGGDATNVVMPTLSLRAEARSHNAAFRRRIVREFHSAFRRAAESVRDVHGRCGSVAFEAETKYESFRLPKSEASVKLALAAVRRVGLEPSTRIANGGLDANWMTAHGFPTVTIGCGQFDIHTVDERLHVPSYLDACRIALELATASE
ncbi:MAG: M20/M25/M40 family metallo-hydrolase [Planctomycetota bacterium]|nr:MAG: M20/M25/M40 family metallo-hydrolase [Planctomycetota bacterium]